MIATRICLPVSCLLPKFLSIYHYIKFNNNKIVNIKATICDNDSWVAYLPACEMVWKMFANKIYNKADK